jgi:hypothetical protein
MSDKPNGHSTAPIQPPVIHNMLILFNETTGDLNVQGVPQSKVTALGMLDLARFLVIMAGQTQQAPLIAPAPPGLRLR